VETSTNNRLNEQQLKIPIKMVNDGSVWHCVWNYVSLNLKFFFIKIECGLYFLDRFDVLMSKMIFKK